MKRKIYLIMLIIALFAVVASTIGVTTVSYRILENQVRHDLRINAELLQDSGVFDDPDGGGLGDEQFSQISSERLRITWVDRDGSVLYDNDIDVAEMGNHRDRPEIAQAMKAGFGESIRKSDTFQMNNFYYALRLENGTVIRVAMEANDITSVLLAALPAIVLIALGIIVVCMLISGLLTRQIIAPINRMAERIAEDGKLVDDGAAVYKELEPFENKIRSQHDKILQAARMRQDFTASVSHELKTPLTAISGYAELIENRMVEPDQEIYFASQIRANSDRLVATINDIISLSELDNSEIEKRQMSSSFVETDLLKLAEDVCEDLQVNARRRRVTLDVSGRPTMKAVDAELIRELIANLVQNAIQYNREDGFVSVEVGTDGGSGAITGEAFIRVRDNGIGIPEESQERIFERFYRVDKSRSRERGGTGLGLALVKHIAEIHNARVTVDSKVGEGTCIVVRF